MINTIVLSADIMRSVSDRERAYQRVLKVAIHSIICKYKRDLSMMALPLEMLGNVKYLYLPIVLLHRPKSESPKYGLVQICCNRK